MYNNPGGIFLAKYTFDTKKKLRISKVGFFICLFLILAFILQIGIAHYFAQKNGFNWMEYELSGLVFGGIISKTLFSIACISTGVCLFFVLMPLNWYIHTKNLQVGYLLQSFVSSIALIGLGIFLLIQVLSLIMFLLVFFLFPLVYCSFTSQLLFLNFRKMYLKFTLSSVY